MSTGDGPTPSGLHPSVAEWKQIVAAGVNNPFDYAAVVVGSGPGARSTRRDGRSRSAPVIHSRPTCQSVCRAKDTAAGNRRYPLVVRRCTTGHLYPRQRG
jgi:hypothetical protein